MVVPDSNWWHYINTLKIDNRAKGRLYTFPGIVLTKQNNNKWKLLSRTVAQTRRADCRRYKPVLSRLQTPPHLAFGLVQQAKLAEELSLGLGLEWSGSESKRWQGHAFGWFFSVWWLPLPLAVGRSAPTFTLLDLQELKTAFALEVFVMRRVS